MSIAPIDPASVFASPLTAPIPTNAGAFDLAEADIIHALKAAPTEAFLSACRYALRWPQPHRDGLVVRLGNLTLEMRDAHMKALAADQALSLEMVPSARRYTAILQQLNAEIAAARAADPKMVLSSPEQYAQDIRRRLMAYPHEEQAPKPLAPARSR